MNRDISGVEWDDGNWPKCGKHGVSKEEIEALLISGNLRLFPDPFQREVRLRGIGQTANGRYVFLVWTVRMAAGESRIRPISARFMHADEVKDYEF